MQVLQLYFDDSGSRLPDHEPPKSRAARDYFALGGILIEARAKDRLKELHKQFCDSWSITYPLRSHDIRERHDRFLWLRKRAPEERERFLHELEEMLKTLPITVIACVVDRPGYNARYKELYGDGRWKLCKTAFAILIERAAKYADSRACKLQVYFEQSGAKEDRAIEDYLKSLKRDGMPFDLSNSTKYAPLEASDFRRIVLGDAGRVTKAVPMCQIADLCLYPVATGGYQRDRKQYVFLKENGKLIDCLLTDGEVPHLGIKYSCFDGA